MARQGLSLAIEALSRLRLSSRATSRSRCRPTSIVHWTTASARRAVRDHPHLAFYSGWANATSAVAVAKEVFDERHIGADQLPPPRPRLALDEAAEAQRAAGVAANVGPVAPGLEQFTTDVLFRDLWLRPGLAPRDRSLVTVSALMNISFENKVALVTGAASGLGLATAKAFAESGAVGGAGGLE